MLDEKSVYKITYNNKTIELKADFRAFKRLNKISGNAFLIMDQFVNDVVMRLEHLPLIIQAMSNVELSIEEIENEVLGLEYIKVVQASDIILNLLSRELVSEVVEDVEEVKN